MNRFFQTRGLRVTLKSMRHRILVVDDDLSVREALKLTLEDDYRVSAAASVREAFALLDHWHVDVVLLDFKMPGMDGIDFLKRLAHTWPSVPVVMVTATTDIGLAARTFAHGAVDYITKPFDVLRIQNNIRKICVRQAHARALSWQKRQLRFQALAAALPELMQWFEAQMSHTHLPTALLLSGATALERELLALQIFQRHFGQTAASFVSDVAERSASARMAGLLDHGLWYLDTELRGTAHVGQALLAWQSQAVLPELVVLGAQDGADDLLASLRLDRPLQVWELPALSTRPQDQAAEWQLGLSTQGLDLSQAWAQAELRQRVGAS